MGDAQTGSPNKGSVLKKIRSCQSAERNLLSNFTQCVFFVLFSFKAVLLESDLE